MWAGVIRFGLPSITSKPLFISGIELERLHQRVADEVGERHLAAAGPGEVVVDDGAVVPQQLDRHGADAGRGRHGQADVHVLHGAGGRAAQHGQRRLVDWPRRLRGPLGLLRHRRGGALAGVGRLLGAGAAWRSAWSPSAAGFAAGFGRLRRGASAGGLRGLRLRGGLGAGLRGAGFARPWSPWRRRRPHRWCRRAVAAGGFSLKNSPTPCRRCRGPAGSARTSRRRATRWLRSRLAGCRLAPPARPEVDAPGEDSATAWIASSDEFL